MTSTPSHIDLPAMYPKQHDALMRGARFTLIEGSTKSGKTAGCMIWQLVQILRCEASASVHWWVAPVYLQAKIAFRRAQRDFEPLIADVNKSDLCITMCNGAMWFFKSGDNPDSLYGEECSSIVIDEASRLSEDVFTACRSTLTTTRGPLRAIGNVKGRRNWFYLACRRAEAGAQNYSYAKLTAQDAVDGGAMQQDELDQAERDLPEHVFRELYFCEPSDDAHNPFGLDRLDAAWGLQTPGAPVVWGLDVARKKDWMVLIGLDAIGNVVAMDRWQGGDWQSSHDRVLERVGTHAPLLVDSTGVGDAFAEELERRRMNVTRFVFTASSKQELMQELRTAFAYERIHHEESVLKHELEAFEYKTRPSGGVSYSAPTGMHDDAVCALALAWLHGQRLGLVHRATYHGGAQAIGAQTTRQRARFR